MVNTVDHIKREGRYTIKQAATALGINRATLYNWIKAGKVMPKMGRVKHRMFLSGNQLIRLFNDCY